MSQVKYKSLMPRVASVRLFLISVIFSLAVPAAASAYSTAALRDKDVQKAERIIVKLHRLEEVTATALDSDAYKAEIAGLYPGLFVDASELRESDLKTDLTTAVFLYETAYRTRLDLGARRTDCVNEMREIYLKLCRETQDGDSLRLLWSMARLHTRWGEAVVRSYRGAADPETLKELSEIEAERKVDITLAEHAVAALKGLAERVGTFSSEDAFENALRAKEISFEQVSGEGSKALSTVDRVLASLPRGRLYLLLHNARCSYQDGLFWWGKTYRIRERTVSVNNLSAPDPLKVIGLSASTVNSTALANWRNALKYMLEAEKAISSLKA
jgi:hypothetical protein